jgi:hypothetical protein
VVCAERGASSQWLCEQRRAPRPQGADPWRQGCTPPAAGLRGSARVDEDSTLTTWARSWGPSVPGGSHASVRSQGTFRAKGNRFYFLKIAQFLGLVFGYPPLNLREIYKKKKKVMYFSNVK